MKKIYLVRHAKSSWETSGINDHERPLNERGISDAPLMAKKIMDEYEIPQLLIASSAKRAHQTALIFAEQFGKSKESVMVEKNLYHADIEELLSCINGVDNEVDHICIFAHNPGITYFANIVCEANIHDVPTCGILIMESDIPTWQGIEASDIKLNAFIFPKMVY